MGAGGGIGRASARLLAKEGANVVVADLDGAAAAATANSILQAGGRATSLGIDVTASRQRRRARAGADGLHRATLRRPHAAAMDSRPHPGWPAGRLGAPEDLAGAVVYLASDESRWTMGTAIVVDGGNLAE